MFYLFCMRAMAIIQLCLAFTALAWYAIYPFMGDWYAVKSQKLLFEAVMGKSDPKNAKRFENLPYSEQSTIERAYNELLVKRETPFATKSSFIFRILIKEISPYEQAWIFFSILIAIFVLLQIKGVEHAIWILPALVLLFGIENHFKKIPEQTSSLFPAEKLLVERYLDGNNSGSITQQREQLENAWKRYLIQEWGHEEPSSDSKQFQEQYDNAFHSFNIARLKETLAKQGSTLSYTAKRESPIVILIYFVWNLLFAWSVFKSYNRYQIQYS